MAAGAVALGVYLANGRPIGSGDTMGPALVPIALVTRGSLDLAPFAPALAPPGMIPYYLHPRAGGLWTIYSPAPGILVTPLYVPTVRWFNRIPRTPAEWVAAAERWQKPAAAFVTAVSAAVFLELLLTLGATTGPAILLTAAYAFGSQAWSVSAQALWQHGPATLALLVVGRAAVSFRTRAGSRAALAGGIALGIIAAVRPFVLVLALPIAAWAAAGSRRMALRMLWGVPALGLGALWIAYSRWLFGAPLGMYRDAFGAPTLEALAGLLLSPARGLLPYFPVALLALPGFLAIKRTGWTIALGLGAVAHVGFLALHPDWGAGHGFGPRYMTEVQPVLLLLALLWIGKRGAGRGRIGLAAALIGWGVGIQSVGALLHPAGCWDDDPVPVESAPERLWHWRDNPVAREFRTAFASAPRSLPLASWSARYRAPASLELRPGATVRIPVDVTNTGQETWPIHAGKDCGCIVHLSWHLSDARGRSVRYEGTRAALGRAVGPGETIRVMLPVTAPAVPGEYWCTVTLVQERVGWFEDRGVRPAMVRLRCRI